VIDWHALTRDLYLEKGEDQQLKNWRVTLTKADLLDLGLLTKAKLDKDGNYSIPCYQIFKQYDQSPAEVYQELENKYGPLLSKKDRRKQKASADQVKLDKFKEDVAPAYAAFLAENFSEKQIISGLPFYQKMAKAWERPAEGLLLPTFALQVLGDPHAFDRGKRGRGLLEKIIKAQLGEEATLEDFNVYPDQLYNFAMTANLLDTPLTYNIIALPDIDRIALPEKIKVYLHENSGVTTALASKFSDRAFVCTGGQVNLATKKLIKRLLANSCQLYYSGDLDQSGIKIADNLLLEFPEIHLLNMDLKTYKEHYQASVPPVKDKQIKEVENPDLQEVLTEIQKKKRVIFEEAIHEFL
jgi:uncharacterized protein (TIGR02679 family)